MGVDSVPHPKAPQADAPLFLRSCPPFRTTYDRPTNQLYVFGIARRRHPPALLSLSEEEEEQQQQQHQGDIEMTAVATTTTTTTSRGGTPATPTAVVPKEERKHVPSRMETIQSSDGELSLASSAEEELDTSTTAATATATYGSSGIITTQVPGVRTHHSDYSMRPGSSENKRTRSHFYRNR
jgi:hypothetical protein